MARMVKLTDEQLKKHLDEGMKAKEIAEKYDINKTYLYSRIGKIRKQEEEMGSSHDSQTNALAAAGVNVLDTFVRKKDRVRFRVTAIENGFVTLKRVYEDCPQSFIPVLTVPIDKLWKEYEKADCPEVKTYKLEDMRKEETEPKEVKPGTEAPRVTRRDCLQSAIDIVCKDREDTYGSPEDNFSLIAQLWSVYTGTGLSGKDVAMMMALLKIARIKTGKHKADNYIDLAGYAACACEIGDNNEN